MAAALQLAAAAALTSSADGEICKACGRGEISRNVLLLLLLLALCQQVVWGEAFDSEVQERKKHVTY
jgi:hypothetical protein